MKKVKILGFQLELAKNVSVNVFYKKLKEIQEQEITINGKIHILLIDIIDEYICGLFLTYKANKKSLITQKNVSGELIVNKAMLKAGENGTEVCIFCINPITLKGLFYNYSGAASPTGIRMFLKKRHDSIKCDVKFEGNFDLKILATKSDLDDIISRYKKINQVILKADNALVEDVGMFSPIVPMVSQLDLKLNIDK